MNMWSKLEDNLIRYRDYLDIIRLILQEYETECLELISLIKGKSFDESQEIFNQLYELQLELATAMYKYEFNLMGDNLKEFIYHFDRDDEYARRYWYQRFNDGLLWPSE